MGLGVKNITLGADYKDYLMKQIEQVAEKEMRLEQKKLDSQMRHKNYNLQGMTDAEIKKAEQDHNQEQRALLEKRQQDNLNRFTRCSGELAKEFGLDGTLSSEKMAIIADLESGKDPRTAPFVKTIKTTVKTIKDESTAHIIDKDTGNINYLNKNDIKNGFYKNSKGDVVEFKEKDVKCLDIRLTKKDIENGYAINADGEHVYFNPKDIVKKRENIPEIQDKSVLAQDVEKRKTATELTFTVDNTFSYRYQMMNDEQKREFEKIFFESADKAFNNEIAHHFKNSQGVHGSLLVYDVMHTDNRDGRPFVHIHKDVSNIMKMEDGSISATELDAIKQAGFHQRVDALFKAEFIERFKESFPDIAVETYDKSKKSVLSYDDQRVKDYRVAFDDESLEKIKAHSTTPEKIQKVVDRQLSDEKNRFKKVLDDIEHQKNDGILNSDQYNKKVSNAYQEHEKKEKFINSSKNKATIQANIKKNKADESLDDKTQRLDDFVSYMNLKEKSNSQEIGLVHPDDKLSHVHDYTIINHLTATKGEFTENQLITEYVNHYGKAGNERARAIMEIAKNKAGGVESDLIAREIDDEKGKRVVFTSKALIKKEFENLNIMRNQMSKDSKVHITQKELHKEIQTLETDLKAKFADGQKEFINAVFNEKNATIAIGVPGAGKSFAINGASKIAHSHGFKTYGIAPTNKVSADLGTTAIGKSNAFTVQSFNAGIANGKIKLDDKSIVFMDESSMVDTRSWNDLLKNIDASNAKLIVVGDTNQISAVGTGQTLTEFMRDKDVIKHKDNIVVLDEITRQKDQVSMMIAQSTSLAKAYKNGDVEQLKASGDHIRHAFDIMEKNDRVNKYENTQNKIDGLVADYMQDTNACKDKLILSSTNESVNIINSTIQDERLKKGELSKEFISNGEKDFHVGDRIIMKDNNKDGNAFSRDDEKALFKEFSRTPEQKQAYKDFKANKISETDFKDKQQESFKQFKQQRIEQQEQQNWKDFQNSDEQKKAYNDLRAGNIDENTYKENQKIDFVKYKLDHNKPLSNGYSNGDTGTIKEIRDGKAIVAFDNGTVSQIQVKGNENVDLGYSITLHKSQGQTVANSYLFMESSGINNSQLCNVALTRMKYGLQVYATDAEYHAVKEQYCRQDDKQLLTDLGREYGLQPQKQAPEHTKELSQEQHQDLAQNLAQSQQHPEMTHGFLDRARTKLQGMVAKFKKEKSPEQDKSLDAEIKKHGLFTINDVIESEIKIEPIQMPDAIKAQKALEQQGSQSQSIQQEQAKSLNNEMAHSQVNTPVQAKTVIIKKKQQKTRSHDSGLHI